MKIIEALKKIKDLRKKADDLVAKIKANSAHLNFETPLYTDQKRQVSEWIQAHSDIVKEILRLRIAVQKTNLVTQVTVELDGKNVTKSVAEWIHRRKDLAGLEKMAWAALTDRGLKEGFSQNSMGQQVEVKIIRCFDPKERDNKISLFDSEPVLIDSKLEIVNAVTDLID